MKATGIVRRVDDLGRIVIPKEIRRTLKIREGDPLEIYTEKDGGVIFRKYSPMGDLQEFFSTKLCIAFTNFEGAADFFRNNNTAKVVNTAYNTCGFHIYLLILQITLLVSVNERRLYRPKELLCYCR
jgi:AbrB family looped-hinge helix DNA binding protein